MKRQFAFLLLGLGAVLVACGQLARATLAPAPNDIEDSLPQWSPDGSRIAFDRAAPGLQHIVTMRNDGKDLYVATFGGHLRGFVPGEPPYLLVEAGDETTLTTGGRYSGPRAVLHGTDASAASDGVRVAYLRDGTLYVARLDNLPPNHGVTPSPSAETAVAAVGAPAADDVLGPVWSPGGTKIAFAGRDGLVVAATDGSGSATVVPGPVANPSWTRDGTAIAYQTKTAGFDAIFKVAASGGTPVQLVGGDQNARFPQFSPRLDALAWISDRQHVRGGATQYRFALYVRVGAGPDRKLVDDVHPFSPARWSPNADDLVVSAGQECLRWGMYVVRSYGGAPHRLSNLCRYDGTPAADTIHASPYFDIMNGLGGDDRLYGFWGNDKILGENGNDTIVGDAGHDVIFGGPGDDVIFGGPGNDTIIGGPGRDRIDCGPGIDIVEGAGRLDRIAKNCEHVRR